MSDHNNIHNNFESVLGDGQEVKRPSWYLMPLGFKKLIDWGKARMNGWSRKTLIIIVISMVGVSIFTIHFWPNNQNRSSVSQSSDDVHKLIARVGMLIVLPTDEEPTIATVSDPKKLQGQPFFADARVGYKVIIYAKARRAILYDPVFNKIVNIAPINLGQ